MDFLDHIILDNNIRSYLIVAVTLLVVVLFKRLFSRAIAYLLFRGISKATSRIDKQTITNKVIRPLGKFLVIIVSVLVIDKLNFPEAWRFSVYHYPSQQLFINLGSVLIIIYLVRFLLHLIDFIALALKHETVTRKEKNEEQLIVFFRDFLKVIIIIAGLLMLVKVGFNQNIGSLLTGLSIVGAAMALAAKESLENLIASFIIFFDKPFYVGDTLKVNNVTGAVEKIGLRSTRIRTADKTLVTVPNKQMVDSIVDNFSMRNQRRAEIKLELAVNSSSAIIEHLIDSVKNKLQEKKTEVVNYTVLFTEFNKNGATITIEYFTIPFSLKEFNILKQELILSFKSMVDRLNVKMAPASQVVTDNADSEPIPPPSKTII